MNLSLTYFFIDISSRKWNNLSSTIPQIMFMCYWFPFSGSFQCQVYWRRKRSKTLAVNILGYIQYRCSVRKNCNPGNKMVSLKHTFPTQNSCIWEKFVGENSFHSNHFELLVVAVCIVWIGLQVSNTPGKFLHLVRGWSTKVGRTKRPQFCQTGKVI